MAADNVVPPRVELHGEARLLAARRSGLAEVHPVGILRDREQLADAHGGVSERLPPGAHESAPRRAFYVRPIVELARVVEQAADAGVLQDAADHRRPALERPERRPSERGA